MLGVIVEIVCCSVDDALAAHAGGASQIELCAALGQGGLTPTTALLREVKARVPLPVFAMVRPRAGGFCYSETEFALMRREAAELIAAGADGLVTGCLTADGQVDVARNRELVALANGKPVVCHRCIDVVVDPEQGLEDLIASGFTRVLTSGRANRSLDGAERIRAMIAQAKGRIEVLPGGGIPATEAAAVVAATESGMVHLAPFRTEADLSTAGNPEIRFAGSLTTDEGVYNVIDADAVRLVVSSVSA